MIRKKKILSRKDISPDEIFLDSKNTPGFNRESFEGVIESAITSRVPNIMMAVFVLALIMFASRAGFLQVANGSDFYERSKENILRLLPLIPERGIIYDRFEKQLTWNKLSAEDIERVYLDIPGLSHLLGYVGYLSESESDNNDNLLQNKYGKSGIEKKYDEFLRGEDGARLVEVDSRGRIVSESTQKMPKNGSSVFLSIDSEMQSMLYEFIGGVANERGFVGGAGVVLDTQTGGVVAITSWPEFNSTELSSGNSSQLGFWLQDPKKPFFFRAISGLYPPGSIIKPIVALAALKEGIIDENKKILSTGSISIQNPYTPSEYSVFYDWKAHGFVDLRKAIAVSSNVYFYTIGGGFDDINGLGISKIKDYANMFGLADYTGVDLPEEESGFFPDSEWKLKSKNDVWRVGDTYNASIGQGDIQVTPIQMAVVASTIANNGVRIQPYIAKEIRSPEGWAEDVSEGIERTQLEISDVYFKAVKEGMRMAVTSGTAKALSGLVVDVAGKTGTAEIGSGKFVNSWIMGFAPYDNPKFAFAIVMEKGDAKNLVGAPYVARQLLDWIIANRQEYI